MYWSKVIFIMIMIKQLDSVQNKDNGTDDSLSTEKNISCPLTNISITPMVEKNTGKNYIYLNITWDQYDKNETVTVKVMPSNTDVECLFNTMDKHNVNTNQLCIPEPKRTPGTTIEPKCKFDITFEEEKVDCYISYEVPECVENICDCKIYGLKPSISFIKPISSDTFLVKWDPGEKTINNKSYSIENVSFSYELLKGHGVVADFYEPPNFKEHTALITMQLFEGENCTLQGNFWNNYSCIEQVTFAFTAPYRSNIHWTFFASLTLLLVLMAYKHKLILKYVKKILSYIVPGLSQAMTSHQNQPPITPLEESNELVPLTPNMQYTPVEFLRGEFDEYEFPRNKILLKEVIGTGAFGRVYSAKAHEIGGIEGYQMVAVKTLGEGEQITREAADDFKAEIEIFKKIGRHPNIVALLGCCTLEAPCMMIMELVPCGDLKKYLLEIREQWLATKSQQVFFSDDFKRSDNSDETYIDPPSPTSPVSITSSRLPSTSETVFTTLEDPRTPLLSQYKQALERVLDHNELQKFALQIAKGMTHLEKIPITHRDLATRNILINENKILKISDFGLSRTGPYINQKTKRLPLRWMAIEAIVNQKYDSKSDVWSFGVVLWEIGTLGAFPYDGMLDSYIQQFLQMGGRLERPEVCTDELYSLMRKCWAVNPEERPTFQDLVDALDVKKRKVYVNFNELNPTYVFPPSDVKVKPFKENSQTESVVSVDDV